MFRWTTAQPLPQPLLEHLAQSGGFRVDWQQRAAGMVLIYLAPHQLVSAGQLPAEALEIGASLSLHASEQEGLVAIHGERLWQCPPERLSQWVPGQPLPCSGALAPPAPLDAAVTTAILRQRPALIASYTQLEAGAERGGISADLNYSQRLEAIDPEALVQAWNERQRQGSALSQQAERRRWSDLDSERRQIAAEQERLQRQGHQQSEQQQMAAELLRRCLRAIARLLANTATADHQASASRTTPPA